MDSDAPKITDVFYGHLFQNGQKSVPDVSNAAFALHLAVKKLREEKGITFQRWVPFVHYGI